MKGVFVTGTDTDVGKTIVSSLLSYFFSFEEKTTYFKPIQAGSPFDRDVVANLCGDRVNIKPSTYTLKLPASPDRSAEKEGVRIEVSKILADFDFSEKDRVVVEGAGGFLVPINESETIADLAKAMDLPIVVVASGRLGTINHTLLTLDKIKSIGLNCLGIVLSGSEDLELDQYLEERSGVPVLLRLPTMDDLSAQSFDQVIEKNHLKLEAIKKKIQSFESNEVATQSLMEKDKSFVWHPFTQHGIVKSHPIVTQGSGSYLYVNERKIIDGISSWWVNLFGHSHPLLSRAIKKQVDQLEHVIFAGFTHKPAIELSEKLVKMTKTAGASLEKVFFSDNGSTSVEVAVKMVYQYHQQMARKKKKRFLALKGSYHGDTLGAMSVGERKGFNEVFTPLMFPVDFVDPFDPREIEKIFHEKGDEIAGIIVEPMVQGASGMRMYPLENLNLISRLSKKHDCLVICDEVFTGFYRTGKVFAFEHSELKPDLLCLSKGLTGGFLPLAVTMVTKELYEAFYNQDMRKAFLHGHSYTANPMACAVASQTMDLILEEETTERVQLISDWTKECLKEFEGVAGVTGVRQLGTIGAMEINGDDPSYFKGDFAYQFMKKAMERGVLLRPLGGTLYAVPPYCVTKEELQKIYQTMIEVITKDLL